MRTAIAAVGTVGEHDSQTPNAVSFCNTKHAPS